VKTEQNKSEIEKGRHLRLRRVEVELREGSAMAFALGRGGFTSGGEMLDASRGKGEKGGARFELYR